MSRVEEILKNYGLSLCTIDEIRNYFDKEKYTSSLEEFQQLFKYEIHHNPKQVTKETALLRINLIQEELNELYEAYNEEDLVEQLDAYADILYVVFGSIVSSGMQYIILDAFNEVHRSNMSKILEEQDIVEHQTLLDSGEVRLEHIEEKKYLIRRNSDGKIIKPNGYSPANLKQFI